MRSGRADGIAGGRAEPAPDGPLVDLRPSGALLDLGELAAGNASAALTVGDMAIWFTPAHGAVVDRAPNEPRALPRPRSSPVRVVPPERPVAHADTAALGEVIERLALAPLVRVGGPEASVGWLFSALAWQLPSRGEGVVHLDARRTLLPDILQVLFELLCDAPSSSVASADELRAGLRDARALVLLKDASLTLTEADILGDTLRECRIVIAAEPESPPDDVPVVRLVPGANEEPADEELERRVASLDAAPAQLLEVLIAAQGDPVHERVLAAILRRDPASLAFRALGELGLDQPDGEWHRAPSALIRSSPRHLRSERWSAPLARAIAAWAHHARGSPEAWGRGAGAWRRAHAVLLAGEAAGRHEASRRFQEDVALARRWGAWRTMLLDVVDRAEAGGDAEARAWALHQLGSRALCLGDRIAARACLAEARDIRWRTGDRAGAAVTQHNLTLATAGANGQGSRRSWLSALAIRARGRRRDPLD